MARKDAQGYLKGLIGNIILYGRNGEQHMRVKTPARNDISQLVVESRNGFTNVLKLVQSFKPLIDIGFKSHTVNRSAFHSAMSVNMLNYNYAKKVSGINSLNWFQFSEGNLSCAANVTAVKTDEGKIEITWQDTQPGLTAHDDDRVISCIWQNDSGKVFAGPDHITRDNGKLVIDPGIKLTNKVQVFISFAVNEMKYKDRSDRNVSKSKWIGEL
jgi:hypothetical protein